MDKVWLLMVTAHAWFLLVSISSIHGDDLLVVDGEESLRHGAEGLSPQLDQVTRGARYSGTLEDSSKSDPAPSHAGSGSVIGSSSDPSRNRSEGNVIALTITIPVQGRGVYVVTQIEGDEYTIAETASQPPQSLEDNRCASSECSSFPTSFDPEAYPGVHFSHTYFKVTDSSSGCDLETSGICQAQHAEQLHAGTHTMDGSVAFFVFLFVSGVFTTALLRFFSSVTRTTPHVPICSTHNCTRNRPAAVPVAAVHWELSTSSRLEATHQKGSVVGSVPGDESVDELAQVLGASSISSSQPPPQSGESEALSRSSSFELWFDPIINENTSSDSSDIISDDDDKDFGHLNKDSLI